ncbi:MAG: tyrosine--tRNA ligase [Candidatus Omnitrophica bacterium]|nr:tyrosine--tRNA ligase [Candidatus Omnitrophota bacterium]
MMSSLELLCRNAVDVISKEELGARLLSAQKENRPLRVKAGFDPSAPDIHLGHTVLLRKLREFQDLGHKVILLIGDYTAMIGDPTGQTKTRPALSRDEVEKNARTYQDQAFKILDKDPKKIEIVKNSDWFLGKDMFRVFFEKVLAQYTVDQLLAREDFDRRMKENKPITGPEFMYPLLQGYDSVRLKADVELGGTDQKFNLLVGRNLQRAFGQAPQIVMTFPLLVGLDGTQKMSKSLGNTIAVNDSAKDVFGKAMSIPDTLMSMYFNLLTGENGDEIQKQVITGKLHPRDAKVKLAKLLTESLHGKPAADKEAEEFERVFSNKENPTDAPEVHVPAALDAATLLKEVKAAPSSSEAYRLIQQGAVTLDDVKITDPKAQIKIKNGSLLKVGKKFFRKLLVKK